MTNEFAGQRILVTGAGKGIGREICRDLHARGAELVAVSRTEADLRTLRDDTGATTVVADLARPDFVDRLGDLGRIDALVNNAGVSFPQALLDTTVQAFDDTMAINVRAVLLLTQRVARDWIARRHAGAIVNLSSQASQAALRDHAAYCASKGALDMLTKVMALELGAHGIRVNAVNPTVTLTPMGEMAWSDPKKSGPMLASIPLGRFAKPAEVAAAVAFLLGEGASMISGTTLPVDGGFLAT
jgi:NAD(P)-dependent dehydrogenase (short-subunit alcohol dehydrogenase family)